MMSTRISIRFGDLSDLDALCLILTECKKDLVSRGIYQWEDSYPNEDYFCGKIKSRNLYVIENAGGVAGAFVLDEWQSPEWAGVQWHFNNGNYLILHALFIHPVCQGKGYGDAALAFIEKQAIENKYNTIRLDVFSKNQNALSFYEKRSYIKRGEVTFTSKPVNNQTYYCFEKVL